MRIEQSRLPTLFKTKLLASTHYEKASHYYEMPFIYIYSVCRERRPRRSTERRDTMPFPKDHKYTAEEYFALTPEDSTERYELINGELVLQAAPGEIHQDIVGGLYSEIRIFIRSNGGNCKPMIAPFEVVLDEHNVVQPDVMIICDKNKMDGKRCNGAPDFIIEVLSANRRDDLVDKLALYSAHGVREYWIVDPKNEKTLVYFFEKSDFPNIYTFDTPVPVGIYGGELTINISELM